MAEKPEFRHPSGQHPLSETSHVEDTAVDVMDEESSTAPQPTLIRNGLKLKLQGKHLPSCRFTYGIPPFVQQPLQTDYKVLSNKVLSAAHIRYHQVNTGDVLNELQLSCTNTTCLVLINTKNDYQLAPEFTEEMIQTNIPIVILTKDDGKIMTDFVNQYSPHSNVMAELDIDADMHAIKSQLSTDLEKSFDELNVAEAQVSSQASERGFTQRVRKIFHKEKHPGHLKNKTSVDSKDLIAILNKLLFQNERPLVISEDKGTLSLVMSTFCAFEQVKLTSCRGVVCKAIERIKIHRNDCFESDIPLYILLSFCLYSVSDWVECGEVQTFISQCIEKLESLDPSTLAQVVNQFADRGDFKIMFPVSTFNRDDSPSVFSVLVTACLRLPQTDFRICQPIHQNKVKHNLVYSRMMWVSLAFKFCRMEISIESSFIQHVWHDLILKHRSIIVFYSSEIMLLKRGLELGNLMKLSPEFHFNYQCMLTLFMDDEHLRPFQHFKEYLQTVRMYVTEDKNIYSIILEARAYYASTLKDDKHLIPSIIESIDGAILEGITLVDCIYDIGKEHGIESVVLEQECGLWITLLVSLINFTDAKADGYLKDIIDCKESTVLKMNSVQQIVEGKIIDTTSSILDKIELKQFLSLYTCLRIYPSTFLKDFLEVYDGQLITKISDPTWNDFLNEVVAEFSGARNHSFLLDFFAKVQNRYIKCKKHRLFLLDILQLSVPRLFAVEDCHRSDDLMISTQFRQALQCYIEVNALKSTLVNNINIIVNNIINEHSDFQDLVIEVLQMEIIPEFKIKLQHLCKGSPLQGVINEVSTIICNDLGWLVSVTRKQRFCWNIICACCCVIDTSLDRSEDFERLSGYLPSVKQICSIFELYCQHHQMSGDFIVKNELPKDISCISSDEIQRYFQWIRDFQCVFTKWETKFEENEITYQEIFLYASNISMLVSLNSSLQCPSLVHLPGEKKEDFQKKFETLNVSLIKYVPDRPDLNWCTLPTLIQKYGFALPHDLQERINNLLKFPGEVKAKTWKCSSCLNPSISECFNPGSNISLELSQYVTLAQLTTLVQDIQNIEVHILYNLDMLVFFKLNKSKIFDQYIINQIRQMEAARCEDDESKSTNTSFASLKFSPEQSPPQCDQEVGLPLEFFGSSLMKSKTTILNLFNGRAQYSDITANGALELESLDTDREFSILVEYAQRNNINCDGLHGVRNMLELFQYSRHIENIHCVCTQYNLKGCLHDNDLLKLKEIAGDLDSEDARKTLTPNIASKQLNDVKKLLCFLPDTDKKCLDIFAIMQDSAAFYHFVRDRQLYGENGVATFNQKFQLITGQLQHEEYDEQVLNHLYAAFNLITPFMDIDQDLTTLMTRVLALDVQNGLKQLETVNCNITLIKVWFIRAEGDTLQTVAHELNCVMKSGKFTFTFSQDSFGAMSAQVLLEFKPSTSSDFDLRASPSEEPVSSHKVHWNNEQIDDFIRKLGFLDKEKDVKMGDLVKHFLFISEVAYKLLKLYVKLRNLGHLQYLKSGKTGPPLSCCINFKDAENRVNETERDLNQWSEHLSTLFDKYRWLLFFSIPKLLRLYHLISSEYEHDEICIKNVVSEIVFLCSNNDETREHMCTVVERVCVACKNSVEEANTPVVVGNFLNEVFTDHALPLRYESAVSISHHILGITNLSLAKKLENIVHFCPDYSQSQLIRTIISLYDDHIPQSFEVLRCHSSTTEEEINQFMKRSTYFPLKYLFLGVNKLPYELQEHLIKLHIMFFQNNLPGHLHHHKSRISSPSIHFIETAPSLLRDMHWVQFRDHKSSPKLTFEEAKQVCHEEIVEALAFAGVELVYGDAGDGKTHYIKSQLDKREVSIIISVNEGFTPLKAISRLRSLSHNQKNCGIFFNFTMLPPMAADNHNEKKAHNQLMEVIKCFFFDLFFLGYVEDRDTGISFTFPGGLNWTIFVEVPSLGAGISPESFLKQFCDDIPVLDLVGTPHTVQKKEPYCVDEDVQLVCKYLKAYNIGGKKGIDRLYDEGGPLVKFSEDSDLTEDECHKLLQLYMSNTIKHTKLSQRLFIKYMKRRCMFLDKFPAFNYNKGLGEYIGKKLSDTKKLGSTLMQTMLSEVEDFCDPAIRNNCKHKIHQQLIYDFKDGHGTFGLISMCPDDLSDDDKRSFLNMGVKIPSSSDLCDRDILDGFLSRALNIEKDHDGRISLIDDSGYVLTLDYTIKMLNIHERYECGVPVVLQGETGVGKTALVEILSRLWNHSILMDWKRKCARITEFLQNELYHINPDISDNYQACIQSLESIACNRYDIDKTDLLHLCQLADGSRGELHTHLMNYLRPIHDDPIFSLLDLKGSSESNQNQVMMQLFERAFKQRDAETAADLLYAILTAEVAPTFHKINVHAAMTPDDIQNIFTPIFQQARDIKYAFDKRQQREYEEACKKAAARIEAERREALERSPQSPIMSMIKSYFSDPPSSTEDTIVLPPNRVPYVTVFLDEINTSSCAGLFKEIIVDNTLDGEPIPENVFIVAACNPHRGNSLATHVSSKDNWVRGSYYVRRLHPTLHFLMWEYGSLSESQECDYINSKMKMLTRRESTKSGCPSDMIDSTGNMSNLEIANLTKLIVTSQNCMREYAYEQLLGDKDDDDLKSLATVASHSCVSQRDIQRVFTIYQWLMKVYESKKPHGSLQQDYNRRAVLIALGIVYYMRLSANYRARYERKLNEQSVLPGEVNFTQAFNDELSWYIKHIKLPKGIACTRALMENVFATIICTVTHIPLIIVGAPGSSKTLSFNQTVANLKGPESRQELFRDVSLFKSLDPHYYQCSRRTTSNEVQTVFSRAINRQRSHAKFNLPINCVVFMDEAGLPEESHESLKVLHYHLDKQEVSFVGITNHVLDAAKTNRAVSLFRPEASNADLKTLAKGCLCSEPENPPPELKLELDKVVRFCQPYSDMMKHLYYSKFFGLRDFIHFVTYLRRKRDIGQNINAQMVVEALERNFNGCEPNKFESICESFLHAIDGASSHQVHRRGILEIVRDSLHDRPQNQHDISENEVRYKLIIDPSDDDSLVRLLFAFGILNRENTRVYVCSDFPGDGELQKINTIAAIRYSAIKGHTVVLSQTDDIHESFYDLFNKRFRRIDDPVEGPRYYTNIAIGAHLKPSRVHPNFQCLVVVKKSDIDSTPAPFLNRFEKYLISHSNLLETIFSHMPEYMATVIKAAIKKVKEFITNISGSNSIYGLQPDTLESLVLTLLPPLQHEYLTIHEATDDADRTLDVQVCLLQQLLFSLKHYSGFNIPYPANLKEVEIDAKQLFMLVLNDPVFEGLMPQLDHTSAVQSVAEAINILHTGTKTDVPAHHKLSAGGCMVVSLFQQWLVRYLCKKIMQIMIPEALILNRNKIPSSYLKYYLSYQSHFSLKDLIMATLRNLEAVKWDLSGHANKILCFTRTSPMIKELPSQFQWKSPTVFQTSTDKVKKLIYDNTDQLVLLKLSNIVTQSVIQQFINVFIQSEKTKVCVILANMQETSKHIVNHLRIMIEEAESTAFQPNKLFVIVLYFAPAQIFKPCYPSLFLKGWDHFYMDTIAHKAVNGVIDIRDWFLKCCIEEDRHEEGETDSLLEVLNEIIPQAIPILSSRVLISDSVSLSSPVSRTTNTLKELLFQEGTSRVLCKRFRSYWNPSEMLECLDRAASFTKLRESTLNMADSVQTMFKTLFFDFLVYMVYQINDQLDLNTIIGSDTNPAIKKLFLDILQVFPLPLLQQVSVLSNNLQVPHKETRRPCFPFFAFIDSSMNKLVNLYLEETIRKGDILASDTEQSSGNEVEPIWLNMQYEKIFSMDNIQNAVNRIKTLMKEQKKTALVLASETMSKHPAIWQHFFSDFMLYRMKLEISGTGITQTIMEAFFEDLSSQDVDKRMVQLYIHVHIHQLDLAKFAGTIRPLNSIQNFLGEVGMTQSTLGTVEHFPTFVIETLFHALVSFVYQMDTASSLKEMVVWFKAYRGIMSLPSLKKRIYEAFKSHKLTQIEGKLNVLHVTYLVLLNESELNDDLIVRGQNVFKALYSTYFGENQELQTVCPRLSNIIYISSEVLTSSSFTSSLPDDNRDICHLFEGLCAHYFSIDRPVYNSEDIKWFMELANKQEKWKDTVTVCATNVDGIGLYGVSTSSVPFEGLTLNMFKFYLGRILGSKCAKHSYEAARSDVLNLYNVEARALVASVLASKPECGNPGPYIPLFYQQHCSFVGTAIKSDNALMQQPLAHLYFMTVLEHLSSKQYEISDVLKLAENIWPLCRLHKFSISEQILTWIELQAVVQIIAQMTPHCFDHPSVFKLVKTDINKFFNCKSMGQEMTRHHAMVVALHVFKLHRDSRQFAKVMSERAIDEIDCLQCFKDQVNVPKYIKPHVFTFMVPTAKGMMAILYRKVLKAMLYIHSGKGNVVTLVKVAQYSIKQISDSADEPSAATCFTQITSDTFRMLVWVVSYYEFYTKQVSSPSLCNVIEKKEILEFFKDQCCVQLILCFLNPTLMLSRPDSHKTLTGSNQHPSDADSYTDTRPVPKDPLHDFFFQEKNRKKKDQSDVQLCHSVANMVAVVLGCPSCSNHLWFHMFAPEQLVDTYITGFLYNSRISPQEVFYNIGVELTDDGLFGHPDYFEHASRGTLTLHSLYLLLWANIGAFCIALLTQPDSDDMICGKLISERIHVRHFCFTQLRNLWNHMRNNLKLTEEERTFLVTRAMMKFYKVVLSPQTVEIPKGLFKGSTELDSYEKLWHLHIYQPAWNDLKSEFSKSAQNWQSKLIVDLRHFESHYPKFPKVKDLIHGLVSSCNLENQSAGGRYDMFLSRFLLEFERLEVGGLLLPRLVKFYLWLHTHLAHVVTFESAASLHIGDVIDIAAKRCSEDMSENLRNMYDFVKKYYNKYIKLLGGTIGIGSCAAVKQRHKVYTISDDVPLVHLLTDVEEPEEGNDWLFAVIDDIVIAHNNVISSLYSTIAKRKLCLSYIPEEAPQAYILEIDETNCLVGKLKRPNGINEVVQLIRRRFVEQLHTSTPHFNISQLEEDLVTTYIAGKPLVKETQYLRRIFKFKEDLKTVIIIPQDNHTTMGIACMTKKLLDSYKPPLEDTLLKQFEYQFHSASFHILVEVVTGLKNVVGHLIKDLQEDLQQHYINESMTIPEFIRSHYADTNDRQALNEIGITNLTLDQFDCLIQLELKFSASCLLLFTRWIDEGFYDFCSVPFPLKTHMNTSDRKFIEKELKEKWSGSTGDLLLEVKALIDALRHSEDDIIKNFDSNSQKPILDYLTDYHMMDLEDQLVKHMPKTILLKHYVSFRQALRRLKLTVEHELEGQTLEEEQPYGQWSEFVSELWQNDLCHLRHEVSITAVEPPVGLYGFQEGSHNSPESDFINDLLKASTKYPQQSDNSNNSDCSESDGDSIKEFTSSDDDDNNIIATCVSHSSFYQEAKERAQISFLHHQILECDRNEQVVTIAKHDICVKIPEGAVSNGEKLHLEIAVAMHGPFKFGRSDNVQPISPILWLCFLEKDAKIEKPFQVVLPHFLTGLTADKAKLYNVAFAKADHHPYSDDQNCVTYNFNQCTTQTEFTASRCRNYGILTTEHCCFYCIKANHTPQLASDAGYCLVRIERHLTPPKREISFAAIFYLSTCVQAVKEQFTDNNNYSITQYAVFKFKDCETDPHIEVIIQNSDQFTLALEPSAAKIRASDINFWRLKNPNMKLRHETMVYPPRVKLTVTPKAVDSTVLTVNFAGCSSDSQLDMQLTLPSGSMASSVSSLSSHSSTLSIESPMCDQQIPTLSNAFRVLIPVASEWMNIGIMLELPEGALKNIEKDQNHNVINCLREALSLWLKCINPVPSWSSLAQAVAYFNEKKADEIRNLSTGFRLDV